jgi:alkyl sulfatase BDS1-like metallo-beta-lactamase superfamily hydrolase
VLDEVATALEQLVSDTLAMMNAGATLDEIIHSVKVVSGLRDRPFLKPLYDEPEFVVRNVWRLYGGWYDGNPAHLKPAPAADLALEIAAFAGGARALSNRAIDLACAGDYRLACHLVEFAVQAAPDDSDVHAARAAIYQKRRERETSLMAKGIFGHAASESAGKA